MRRSVLFGFAVLGITFVLNGCSTSGSEPSLAPGITPSPNTTEAETANGSLGNQPVSTTQAPAGASSTVFVEMTDSLADPDAIIPAVPIVPVSSSAIQIYGVGFTAYQSAGEAIRVVCEAPCGVDERTIDALVAAYEVEREKVVRTAGIDVLESLGTVDVHLARDTYCTRGGGEVGSSAFYAQSAGTRPFICLYLTDDDVVGSDPAHPLTPENAARGFGGVFTHEYAHTIFLGRLASLHDFVFPIEYTTLWDGSYADLCYHEYEGIAPLAFRLCGDQGLTLDQFRQSWLDVGRLSAMGLGEDGSTVSMNQYRSILNGILNGDVLEQFEAVDYMSLFSGESPAPYELPWADEPCSLRAELESDVTVPLGSILDANTRFDKAWRILNAGTCDWDDVELAFVDGEAMTAARTVPVSPTGAGAEVEVTVPMVVPAEAGVHSGHWRLQSVSGEAFGPILNLVVYSRPGCTDPPALSFARALPSTVGAGGMAMLEWGQVTNVDTLAIDGLGPIHPDGGQLLVTPEATTTYTFRATCGANEATLSTTVTVDSSLPPFAMTGLSAMAEPEDYVGSCSGGKRVGFTGELSTNGPGVVVYKWSRSDNAVSGSAAIVFDEAGTKVVTNYWTLFAGYDGWMQLGVLDPIETQAERAQFVLTCSP